MWYCRKVCVTPQHERNIIEAQPLIAITTLTSPITYGCRFGQSETWKHCSKQNTKQTFSGGIAENHWLVQECLGHKNIVCKLANRQRSIQSVHDTLPYVWYVRRLRILTVHGWVFLATSKMRSTYGISNLCDFIFRHCGQICMLQNNILTSSCVISVYVFW